ISLIIQLFITRRVVGVFGIGTSLFFLPAAVFIGAVMVVFLPTLFSAIFIKMSDASLKQSINKSAVELLALPIPAEIKNKTKTFIDVFVDSVATGIGGIILVLIINGFKLSIPYISVMIIITIGIWFYFALNVRKEYIKSFQVKIKQAAGSKDVKPLNLSNESVISGLKRVLENGNEKQILWVLQKSREKPNEKLFNPILKLLDSPSGNIRAEALRNLYFYRQKSIVETVSPFITDPVQEVRIGAFEYLLEHNRENSVELMKQFLENPDYKVSGAALISLAGEVRNNPELKKQYELRQLIAQKIEDLKNEGDQALAVYKTQILLEAIGKGFMSGHFGFIETGLKSENPDIVDRAIYAAGLSMAPQFIDALILFVANPRYSSTAKAALIQYGVEILTFLKPLLDEEAYKEIHNKIPSIAENISSQQSVSLLFEMLESENALARQEALDSLNNLKIRFPFLHFDKKMVIRRILDEAKLIQDTLSVLYLQTKLEKINQTDPGYQEKVALSEARKSLISLLEKRLDSGLERIFKLLGLKFNTEEILSAYLSFQSSKPDIRNSSIEFLDNLLDNKLKRVLIPILETTILETISEEALNNLHIHIPNEMECYNMLLEGNDVKIKLAVLFLLSHSGSKEFIPLVNQYRNNKNHKVKDFAEKAFLALSE
ncbi:MAG TPA: HEAT repeat domain-containing protein, partial [Draconibacterium sp.]|nr:HEAT repeat domain-containing protein [Draconibacterium sp.]